MKNILLTILTFIIFSIWNNLNAQHRSVAVVKDNHRSKTVVYKKKPYRIHPRKRVRRTRAVHYHYRHLPKRGAVVSTIHKDAIVVKNRGIRFRFHSGVWYKPKGKKWVIVKPTIGLSVKALPLGYRKIIIGPRSYYYYYGTYYTFKNDKYEVIEAPLSAEVDSLPDGYKTITINGENYYELDDIYYYPCINKFGEEALIVVKKPTL